MKMFTATEIELLISFNYVSFSALDFIYLSYPEIQNRLRA